MLKKLVSHVGLKPSLKASGKTQEASTVQPPVIRSDAEGTRLNLEGYELIQLKDYKQAEVVLRRAVQSFPEGTTAVAYKYSLYNLGHVLRRNGRAKEAVPYLEKCVKMDPEWSKAQTELAVAEEQAAQSSAALTQVSRL